MPACAATAWRIGCDFLQFFPELIFEADMVLRPAMITECFTTDDFTRGLLTARRIRLTRRAWDVQLAVFQHRLIAVERRVDAGLISARFPTLGMHRVISLALLVRVG
jgi:hypothetical protein